MRQPSYAEVLAEYVRRGIITQADADREMAEHTKEEAALDRGECPRCGRAIRRTLDPRQAGHSAMEGVWCNYRCACGFMLDRKEPVSRGNG